MSKFQNIVIPPEMPVIDALATIDKGGKQIAFICKDGVLHATLSDGDIRRYILQNGDLSAPVVNAGNQDFFYGKPSDSIEHLEKMSRKLVLNCVPILTADGRLIDVYFQNKTEESEKPKLNIPVVIMAGGKGLRLHPYTKILPKPLIPIGDLTITEHIINSFIDYGCMDFSIIINHKKNMIKAYFADNENHAYQLKFIEEDKPLGTGGGLGLIRSNIKETFFMTNCDIMIFEDYDKILERHRTAGNLLTMVCATKQFSIPYGAIEIDEIGQITTINEKPSYSMLANTGFYIIEPEMLDIIPNDTFCHTTDLIQTCMSIGKKVGVYPISEEKWADMGQHDEMERMQERMST